MRSELQKILTEFYGTSVQLTDSSSHGGGCINDTQVLSLSSGEKIFLKHHSHPPTGFFEKEVKGLDLLRDASGGPRVPKVLSARHQNFLLLEYIPHESPKENFHEAFGRALANLHRTTDTHYGLDHNNFIGKTVQQNTPETDPIVFFTEHRIRFQQSLARQRGLLPVTADRKLDGLCERLEDLLDVTGEKPALSHGDLWSGNHFCSSDQQPCIVDPATHFGLREADLAMTELFGRMPQRFYDAYHEAFPTNPGYEKRRDLYNLYHLLNHVNLFGGSYLGSVESILNQYVR